VTLIRATHPYAFRCGEWAELKGTTDLPGYPGGERRCYLVEFPDGTTDFWAVNDQDAGYEFADESP
jgi:hypothetical protein